MDRVDLRVEMHMVRAGAFTADEAENTATVRQRVAQARAAAAERWHRYGFTTNAEVTGSVLRRKFRLDSTAMAPLKTALERGVLSIRGVDRSLRVAWTMADLAGRSMPSLDDVAVALSFRQGEAKP
jgi:magnesium chelatase family protein